LDVEKSRPVLTQAERQIDAQPSKRVLRDPPLLDARRQPGASVGLGYVGNELAATLQLRKLVQEIADINFIPR
jgi:hypothetical protein